MVSDTESDGDEWQNDGITVYTKINDNENEIRDTNSVQIIIGSSGIEIDTATGSPELNSGQIGSSGIGIDTPTGSPESSPAQVSIGAATGFPELCPASVPEIGTEFNCKHSL